MKNTTRSFFLLVATLVLLNLPVMGSEIDLTFNPRVQTTTYLNKAVTKLLALPDGKVIAAGNFNNFDGTPVGCLIRLNSDGTLDPTFNNHLLVGNCTYQNILRQPDGKLVIVGGLTLNDGRTFPYIGRLLANGEIDTSFRNHFTLLVFGYFGSYDARLDASGRVIVMGRLAVEGVAGERNIIRLNDDGTPDPTFEGISGWHYIKQIATQGNKVLFTHNDSTTFQYRVYRLNEDGSFDSSFAPSYPGGIPYALETQPDGTIVVLRDRRVVSIQQDGGLDSAFPTLPDQTMKLSVGQNGAMFLFIVGQTGYRIEKFTPEGIADPVFSPQYSFSEEEVVGTEPHPDGGILLGDSGYAGNAVNRFRKLRQTGEEDGGFNTGAGFQTVQPCKIKAISMLPDGSMIFAGAFDLVDGVIRQKIARLRADGTLDESFLIQTAAPGNYFSLINNFYNIARQADGKFLISGDFRYRLNGVEKRNLVRLNADGSIDPSFELSWTVNDNSVFGGGGTNPLAIRDDLKVLVGTSRSGSTSLVYTPLLLTTNGQRDPDFASTSFPERSSLGIFGTFVQPDGKIVITGRTIIGNVNGDLERGLVARLNANGTLDPSFQLFEPANVIVSSAEPLSDGRILTVTRTATTSKVQRLNPDGTVDPTFETGTGALGRINAIKVLGDERILVGGFFTSFDEQPRRNLALLESDGRLAGDPGALNDEVLSIALDSSGRIILGGSFTSIRSNGGELGLPYLARFNRVAATRRTTPFDYDGDGRSDVSVYRPSEGIWYLQNSTAGFGAVRFGVTSDTIVPADYDGDGKTDIAVFRPAGGAWHVIGSSTGTPSTRLFGNSEDIPVPADFDGDGKADISVFRSSQGVWYRQNSSDQAMVSFRFGQSADVPAVGDYDGDGKADIAVWRPSEGVWYYLRSSDGQAAAERFGQQGDTAVPADFDGDGTTDIAVYRPSTGTWYIRNSSNGAYRALTLGNATDIPAPADYDGDGKADAAVFRPESGMWHSQNSSNSSFTTVHWGLNGDMPTPAR